LELAAAGLLTSGDKTNREYIADDIEIDESVDKNLVKLLFDPQTAGGMLIAVSPDSSTALLGRLKETYTQAEVIGQVVERGSHSILVRSV